MSANGMTTIAIGTLSALLLSACMSVTSYTDSEKEIASDLTAEQYQPATRDMRSNIKTQDLLAQAAFWSREYQLNPADLEAAVNLAATVRKMGNASKAVEITQTTRALYPTDPYLTAEYAAALIASERGAEAVQPLDTALRSAPGYARLWSLKGAALDQMEKYDLARKHYMHALKITPNDPNVMANLGLSYALSGDPKTALSWMQRAAAQPGAGGHIQQNLDLIKRLNGQQPARQISQNTAPAAGYPNAQPALRTAPSAAARPVASNNTARQGSPVPPRRMSYAAPQAQRPVPVQPQTKPNFNYSTQVYTDANSAGAPRSASEAALAAARARQSQPGAPKTMTMPVQSSPEAQADVLSRISQSLATQKALPPRQVATQAAPQQQAAAQPSQYPAQQGGYYPQTLYAQPQVPPSAYYPQAQPTPQRRGPARQR